MAVQNPRISQAPESRRMKQMVREMVPEMGLARAMRQAQATPWVSGNASGPGKRTGPVRGTSGGGASAYGPGRLSQQDVVGDRLVPDYRGPRPTDRHDIPVPVVPPRRPLPPMCNPARSPRHNPTTWFPGKLGRVDREVEGLAASAAFGPVPTSRQPAIGPSEAPAAVGSLCVVWRRCRTGPSLSSR